MNMIPQRRKLLRTPITYYGGKQSLLDNILPLIPAHSVYVEPFFGGGAVFFSKRPSKVEVINDVNSEVMNFYICLKQHFKQLQQMIESTLHSRQMYEDAKVMYNNPHLFHRLQRAWAFWVLTNQGWYGSVGSWKTSNNKNGAKQVQNKKHAFNPHLEQRIAHTQIECRNALDLIKQRDTPDTFFYLDPPYINTHQGHYRGYAEMDFETLLQQLENIRGKFLLSSYASKLLSVYTLKNSWSHVSISQHSAAKKTIKLEVLTANYQL